VLSHATTDQLLPLSALSPELNPQLHAPRNKSQRLHQSKPSETITKSTTTVHSLSDMKLLMVRSRKKLVELIASSAVVMDMSTQRVSEKLVEKPCLWPEN
jgi:hypothetical protein